MAEAVRVMFFGDSICVGQFISIHKGWVTQTSANLAELGKQYGRPVVVTNSSQNGRTTRQALESMAYEIQSPGADILIVQFGMNDCNYWESDRGLPRVSPQAFWANLHEIIDRAFRFGVRKVFLNTNHPTGRISEIMPFTDFSYQRSNEHYNDVIRQVASERDDNVILNKIEEAFKEYIANDHVKLRELLLASPDLLHLSEKGHDLYFKIVYPNLKDAVFELISEKK